MRRASGLILTVCLVAGCQAGKDGSPAAQVPAPTTSTPAAVTPLTTTAAATPTPLATTTTARPDASSRPRFTPPTTAASPANGAPAAVQRRFPIDSDVTTSWTPRSHHDYPATDVFASTNCGTPLHAPVTGVVHDFIRNTYDPAVDDPATRGGNALSIVAADGVRYYMAHFQSFAPGIGLGTQVSAGQYLGELGTTGSSSACHVHVGLSLPCPNNDWWVRRGVIWPDDYLSSWRDGGNKSPRAELDAWFAAHPNACRSPQDSPYPVG